MTTVDALLDLYLLIAADEPGAAEQLWQGADVVISEVPPPPPPPDAFYPEPRWVVTPHASTVSWMFEQVCDAFHAEDRLDGCNKIEFFGRLANAANEHIGKEPETSAADLCMVVFHEAAAMLNEQDAGRFHSLKVALGNEILGDRRE